MDLLTSELIEEFRRVGFQGNKDSEQIQIVAKFFYPCGTATWYAYEYLEEEKIFFGFASLFNDHNDELGYFSLEELQEFTGRFGLGIERDLHFKGCTLADLFEGRRP